LPWSRSLHFEHVAPLLELEVLDELEPAGHNPPQSAEHDLHVQS